MPSRRSVLIGAGQTILGGLAVAACTRSRDGSLRQTDSSSVPATDALPAPTSAPATNPPATSPPRTSPPRTSPPTTSVAAATPWAGADFGEIDAFVESTNGEGFAIVENGTLVHEWYRQEPTYRRDIASAQKSVLSLLVGRAIADGHFATDTKIDDLIGKGWTTHGETPGITVRNLLTMTSGLDDQLDVVASPDTVWVYSGAFAILFDVLVETTGRELNDLATEWLFAPAGADTARFYERRTSQFAPIGLFASIADLTSIGVWVLDQNDRPFGAWLRSSFEADQELNESYGSLWWLNGKESFVLPGPVGRAQTGPLIPTAPADLVAALGKDDQKLYISRDLSLVVARLGDRAVPETRQSLSSFDGDLWSMLLRLRS